jgi:DNA-binding transcriptional regulator YdaS (Cro superfamily)
MPVTINRTKSKSRLTFLHRGTGRFNVGSFCDTFRLKQEAVARLTGYSPRAVADWASGKPLSQSSAQRVTEIERLCDALGKVVKPDSIGRWLQTPNDAFDGSTPLQVIERGEVDRLWRMIHRLESGEPG